LTRRPGRRREDKAAFFVKLETDGHDHDTRVLPLAGWQIDKTGGPSRQPTGQLTTGSQSGRKER